MPCQSVYPIMRRRKEENWTGKTKWLSKQRTHWAAEQGARFFRLLMSSEVQVTRYQIFKDVLYSFRELEGINSTGIENHENLLKALIHFLGVNKTGWARLDNITVKVDRWSWLFINLLNAVGLTTYQHTATFLFFQAFLKNKKTDSQKWIKPGQIQSTLKTLQYLYEQYHMSSHAISLYVSKAVIRP